jgi:hypothetical protein
MKTEKLSLKSIKNVLSRAELKKIMAGSGGGCNTCVSPNECCECLDNHGNPTGTYVSYCSGGLSCAIQCEELMPGEYTGAEGAYCTYCE